MRIAVTEGWLGLTVVVVGDVMLDRFIYGRVDRVSPEAPIPVLHQESERVMLGGAANVARNVVSLGGKAILVGVVGEDSEGHQVAIELCPADGIDHRLVHVAGHPTTVKTRLVSGAQQIVRLDVERILPMEPDTESALISQVDSALEGATAIVLSDYAKGVLSPSVVRKIIDAARARSIPTVVDPKTRDVARFAGATVMTPNAREAEAICGIDCAFDEDAETAAKAVREAAQVDAVVLTRGSDGMTIWAPREGDFKPGRIKAVAREVFDVSGAGDTVVATLSLALAAGLAVSEAAYIANAAAGIAVGKRGTAVVLARELTDALDETTRRVSPKIVSREDAIQIVSAWKNEGDRIGFTNGCFDLLHPGHVELLRQARAVCDRLVVALNTDSSVGRLKGSNRPIQGESARSVVLAAMESVDLVVLFNEDSPIELIEAIRPDSLVKGSDYEVKSVVGSDFVMSYGGKVILVPLEAGHSTTNLVARSNND